VRFRRAGSVLAGTLLSQSVPTVRRMRSDWESSVEASVVPRLRRAKWIGTRRRASYRGHAADSAASVRYGRFAPSMGHSDAGSCQPASLTVSPDESQTECSMWLDCAT
jgi:hypothetical protein